MPVIKNKILASMLRKVKTETLSFEKHPCRELDQEMMMHYLNGLALIASADENICEKEKEYLEILINSFGLSEEILETVVNFAENPDEDLIQDMMEAFTTKDIKYNFMVDCMMISSRDGSFDDSEKGIIEEYFEMFKITGKEAEDLKYIFEIFHKQDGNALYRYFKRNEYMKIELFQYLLDYYKIDMAYELIEDEKKILEFEFFKPTFDIRLGKLAFEFQEIMTEPITNAQFCIFLNSAYMSNLIDIDGNGKVVDKITKNIEMDLNNSDILFSNGQFTIASNEKEQLKITGITLVIIKKFITWICKYHNKTYQLSSFECKWGDFGSALHTNIFKVKPYQEIFFDNLNNLYRILDAPINISGNIENVRTDASKIIDLNYNSKISSFRLMRKLK